MLNTGLNTGSVSVTTKRAVRASLVGLLLLFLVGCQESVERSDVLADDAAALMNMPVEGMMVSGESRDQPRTFKGALTVTSLTYQDGLKVSGVLAGTSLSSEGAEEFENVPATLSLSPKRGAEAGSGVRTASGSGGQPLGCEVLYLELGPLVFNGEFGLVQVSLVEIRLAFNTADSTLGALLCTLAGFLDAGLEVPEDVTAQINALLASALDYASPYASYPSP